MKSHEESAATQRSESVTSTSRSLLLRLKQQEPTAWNRMTLLYTPLVYFWCRKQHVPDQDIPDVVQDVFRTVATSIQKFRKDRPGDTFRGWLRTIVRTRSADYFRKQQNEPIASGGSEAQRRLTQLSDCIGEEDESEEDQVQHALFLRALELVRADFQDKTWKAFWRVVVDGRTPKEAAEELSMQPGAVRVAKSRVLQRLRRDLGELLE